jgi:hypothetical protein
LEETLGVVNKYLDNPILLRDWISEIGKIYEIRCVGASYTESASGEELEQEPRCITYWSDKSPTMPHEVCASLLEAGFLPKTNRYLRKTFKIVLKKVCEKMSGKMHISIPKSTSLICIADDLGILEENEVSVRFNKPFMDEQTGRYSSVLVGDVLVARVCDDLMMLTSESSSVADRHSKGESGRLPPIESTHGCHCILY